MADSQPPETPVADTPQPTEEVKVPQTESAPAAQPEPTSPRPSTDQAPATQPAPINHLAVDAPDSLKSIINVATEFNHQATVFVSDMSGFTRALPL